MVASQRFCLKSPMARRGVRSHRCPSVQRTTIGGGLLTTIGIIILGAMTVMAALGGRTVVTGDPKRHASRELYERVRERHSQAP